MCGISGLLSVSPWPNLDKITQNLQSALTHRGPDDQGVYINGDRHVALTHTRLSILDLTSAGHQPMAIDGDRYWITFNGEIYNFLELRKNLEAQGERFTSDTDTEVILRLYHQKGKDCVQDLRGMFAFAIWDNHEKTCFLARDPLGIKPLFYCQLGSQLVFASELKAILASQLIAPHLNPTALYEYFSTGSVPEPLTLINNVHQLSPGHYLEWHNGGINQSQYWQMDFTPDNNIDGLTAKNIVREALLESVNSHFLSDVPVGIFLSGGVDSTAILALARQTQTANISTYSIAFEETEFDEGSVARKTAKHFATEHHEQIITATSAKILFDEYLKSLDQPSIDGLNTFSVSKLAAEDNKKVVLSGLGSDEIFAGYKSFKTIPKMLKYRQQLQILDPLLKLVISGASSLTDDVKLKRLDDFFAVKSSTTNAYQCMRGIFSRKEASELVGFYCQDWGGDKNNDYFETSSFNKFPSIEDEVSYLEISRYMQNQLLRDSDVMSMRSGLELRVPFVDKLFLETILKIPKEHRLNFGKKLLIESVPEIPEWVINRPKQGFSFPFQQWLDQDWLQAVFHLKEIPKQISVTTWYRKWLIVVLNYWLQDVGL